MPDPTVFVARCRQCNALMAAAVDLPDNPEVVKENAREVAEWIRGGFEVSRTDLATARAGEFEHAAGCSRVLVKRGETVMLF